MLLARMQATRHSLPRYRSVACRSMDPSRTVRLGVIGDVHGQWCARDAAALLALGVDYALFVGDFGNENVPLVSSIASVDVPKAAILGNHDAWYTMTARPSRSRSPSAHNQLQQEGRGPAVVDRVQQQIDVLGNCHIGYAHKAMPGKNISLVGARPFSKGGKSLRSMREFMGRMYGVLDMPDSAAKIMEVINSQVPQDNTLILMGHNGPAGLGDQRYNICGVDWLTESGDHGDPDLQAVLQQLQQAGRHVALVVFGHMHHTLRGGDKRQMVHIDGQTGCVYLNAATVPRVVSVPQRGGQAGCHATKHHFLVVDVLDGQVHCAADVWVQVSEQQGPDAAAAANGNNSNAAQTNGGSNDVVAAAAADGSGSSQQGGTAQKLLPTASSNGTSSGSSGSSGNSSSSLGQDLLPALAIQQAQLVLDQQVTVVGGFTAQVVEVREVLKTVNTNSSSGSGSMQQQQQQQQVQQQQQRQQQQRQQRQQRLRHSGADVRVEQQQRHSGADVRVVKHYWDAYNAEWKEVVMPVGAMAAAPVMMPAAN